MKPKKTNKINKPNETKKSTVKTIIISAIALIILLLLLFAEDIMKLQNEEKIALQENSFETMPNEANVPTLSAGMIPVKWDGTYWIITTQEDSGWYDYTQGKLAYVMLNDGVYQSEPIPDMQNKKLAERHIGVQIQETELGTIFAWIPRFAKNTETGEIKYAPAEFEPGGNWEISEAFMYVQDDETKPNFSLAGMWVQKDIQETGIGAKYNEMINENGIYGFIANTYVDMLYDHEIVLLQDFSQNLGTAVVPFENITSYKRLTLKIISTNKYEPMKANITHNTVDKKIEIQVTYTANGISKILDEYGNELTLTQDNGIIKADTGERALANGTYTFTVIDNKDNRKKLSIDITVNSLYNVAYVNGTDNMALLATYSKTKTTSTSTETTRLNQIQAADTATTYTRAVANTDGTTTAVGEVARGEEDEQLYLYSRYNAVSETKTTWASEPSVMYYNSYSSSNPGQWNNNYRAQRDISIGEDGLVTLSSPTYLKHCQVSYTLTLPPWSASDLSSKQTTRTTYYQWTYQTSASKPYTLQYIKYTGTTATTWYRGDFIDYITAGFEAWPENHYIGSIWYVRGALLPLYTLYKYDANLNLKSTYDVETSELKTVAVDISDKEDYKVCLTLNATGTNHKTYISNDNATWVEVTDITSGVAKELNVAGWNTLYVKIETNGSIINNIDVSYYKE